VNRVLTGTSLLLLFISSAVSTAEADIDYLALLEEATAEIAQDFRNNWAYTETATSSENTRVGAYDPRQQEGKRWTLLSVDGRAPKEKETTKFLKEKQAEQEQAEKEGDKGLASILEDLKNVRLEKETDEYWLLGFTPKAEGEFKKIMSELDGRIKIEKSQRQLKYFSIQSNKSFKPNFTTRINQFAMKFDFEKATEEGPLVLTSLDFDINLKTVGLIEIDEKISVTFTEYTYTGS
jgi:hypothetical protein